MWRLADQIGEQTCWDRLPPCRVTKQRLSVMGVTGLGVVVEFRRGSSAGGKVWRGGEQDFNICDNHPFAHPPLRSCNDHRNGPHRKVPVDGLAAGRGMSFL